MKNLLLLALVLFLFLYIAIDPGHEVRGRSGHDWNSIHKAYPVSIGGSFDISKLRNRTTQEAGNQEYVNR